MITNTGFFQAHRVTVTAQCSLLLYSYALALWEATNQPRAIGTLYFDYSNRPNHLHFPVFGLRRKSKATHELIVDYGTITLAGDDEEDGDAFVWQWQEDDSSWHSYSPSDSAAIEAVYNKDKGVAKLSSGYDIDTGSNTQTKRSSGHKRAVRRFRQEKKDESEDEDEDEFADDSAMPLGTVESNETMSTDSLEKRQFTMAKLGKQLLDICLYSLPRDWATMKPDQVSRRVKLRKTSKEYKEVARHFGKSMGKSRIKMIHRVQNKLLWENYLHTKIQFIQRNAGAHNQRVLFHGTQGTDPAKIYEAATGSGFDPRMGGSGYYGSFLFFVALTSFFGLYPSSDYHPLLFSITLNVYFDFCSRLLEPLPFLHANKCWHRNRCVFCQKRIIFGQRVCPQNIIG